MEELKHDFIMFLIMLVLNIIMYITMTLRKHKLSPEYSGGTYKYFLKEIKIDASIFDTIILLVGFTSAIAVIITFLTFMGHCFQYFFRG